MAAKINVYPPTEMSANTLFIADKTTIQEFF